MTITMTVPRVHYPVISAVVEEIRRIGYSDAYGIWPTETAVYSRNPQGDADTLPDNSVWFLYETRTTYTEILDGKLVNVVTYKDPSPRYLVKATEISEGKTWFPAYRRTYVTPGTYNMFRTRRFRLRDGKIWEDNHDFGNIEQVS